MVVNPPYISSKVRQKTVENFCYFSEEEELAQDMTSLPLFKIATKDQKLI
jgi:hypothetical protein